MIRAGAIAHRETGLVIGAHTGEAAAAFGQLDILAEMGVHPSSWIWIHAQNEKDLQRHVDAAKQGAWISFDGIGPESIDAHVGMVANLRDHGLIGHALVSQDAGWYSVGEPNGGKFRPFDTLFTSFIPALRKPGIHARGHQDVAGAQSSEGIFNRPCVSPTRRRRDAACALKVTTNRLALLFHCRDNTPL